MKFKVNFCMVNVFRAFCFNSYFLVLWSKLYEVTSFLPAIFKASNYYQFFQILLDSRVIRSSHKIYGETIKI